MYLEFNYDQNTTGISGLPTNSQKSGNISQIAWRVRGRDRQVYNYTYDFLDKMTSSIYYDVNASNTAIANSRYDESLNYDLRGNISSLQRTGHYLDASYNCAYGSIDNLGYYYTSNTNRLYYIFDYNTNVNAKPKGFNPSSGGAGYDYDLVGNLKSDSYKGITNIIYNYLNLPTTISWGSSKSIDIVYDAAGNKLSKTVKTGTTTNSIQDYVMGIEYNKLGTAARKVESVYHSEGRYFNTSTTSTPSWRAEYTIKDHLGNARLSITDKNNDAKIDVTNSASTNEILQENHYYSFGMAHEGPWMINDAAKDNPYQYNGKEFNADHGLNWNDYGARFYDPSIGKFLGVDAWTEKYPSWSPYVYTLNNPIRYIDPTGNGPDDPPQMGAVIGGTIKAGLLNLIGLGIKYSQTPRGAMMRATRMSYHFSLREDSNSPLGVSVGGEIRFEQSPIKDAGNAVLSTMDLAPLSPSKGGVNIFAKTPGMLSSIITPIAKEFDNFQCIPCSNAILKALKSEGVTGEIVKLQARGDMGTRAGNVWSDTAKKTIATNGYHQGVLIDGKVYDNIHINGIDYKTWKQDFHSLEGIDHK